MQSSQVGSMIMLGAFMVMFYFMIFLPQRKQQKAREALLKSLAVGDKIITIGGIYGEITELKEKSIRVKIAKDVVVRMNRSGITGKTTDKEEA